MSITRAIALFVAFTGLSTVKAQAGPPTTQPTVHRLSTHPQATTQPALKYRLLPEASERTPGNGAALYFRAALMTKEIPEDAKNLQAADAERLHLRGDYEPQWVSHYLSVMPFDQPSRQAAESVLGQYNRVLDLADLAAHREMVRWETSVREQGAYAWLPELNPLLEMAKAEALRARCQIAMHDYDAAARALQTNLATASGLNEEPTLVQLLTGNAIAGLTLERLGEWVQQPGAPNLYWALAALPRPYFNLRATVDAEKVLPFDTFPELRKVKEGRFTGDDWLHLTKGLKEPWARPFDKGRRTESRDVGISVAAGTALYPAARAYLRSEGLSQEQVDAMPQAQALGRYMVDEYEATWDEGSGWVALPYWQAESGLLRLDEQREKMRSAALPNPLVREIPGLSGAAWSVARVDRQIATLQTIEALRAYAAGHDGRLPDKLEDLIDTPAPVNPMTGKAFIYSVHGKTATLESPFRVNGARADAERYELTIVN